MFIMADSTATIEHCDKPTQTVNRKGGKIAHKLPQMNISVKKRFATSYSVAFIK
jgi:hypothetical protein